MKSAKNITIVILSIALFASYVLANSSVKVIHIGDTLIFMRAGVTPLRAGIQYSNGGQDVYMFISSDVGGIDNQNGLFMCAGAGHLDKNTGQWVTDWHNPLINILPQFIQDC